MLIPALFHTEMVYRRQGVPISGYSCMSVGRWFQSISFLPIFLRYSLAFEKW